MNEVFVVAKNVSIDSTIIGVTGSLDEAKRLCQEDYVDNDEKLRVAYTFTCFEISKLYKGPVDLCYDYVPGNNGSWSEVKVERFFDFSEGKDENCDNG
jgi:hypothetical protein